MCAKKPKLAMRHKNNIHSFIEHETQHDKRIITMIRMLLCPQINNFTGFFNPFPNKPRVLRVCSICLLKKLWEKDKLLVTSNFSFSHIIFYPFGELSAFFFFFFQIQNCRLQVFQFGVA